MSKELIVVRDPRKIGITLYVNRGLWYSFLSLCRANRLAAYRAVEVAIQEVLERHGITLDESAGPYALEPGTRTFLGGDSETEGVGASTLGHE